MIARNCFTQLLAFAGSCFILSASATLINNVPADKRAFEMPSDGQVAIVDSMLVAGEGTIVLGSSNVSIDSYSTAIPVTYTNIVRGFTTSKGHYPASLCAKEYAFRGTATISDMQALPVKAEWGKTGDIELGPDERIIGTVYTFGSRYKGPTRNDSRCLKENHCFFNTHRWCFKDDSFVTYCHTVKGRKLLAAKVDFSCCHVDKDGQVVVEASRDGKNWTDVGLLKALKNHTFKVPETLFPAEALWIRLSTKQGELQVEQYGLTARLDGEPLNAFGSVAYREAKSNGAVLLTLDAPAFYRQDYGSLVPGGDESLKLWTASSGWKVPRSRCLPTNECRGVALRTAANEAEAVQLIVKPTSDLADIRVSVSDLKGKGGALLKASALDIFRIGYVKVDLATDYRGARDAWPDPLLPQEGAFAVKAHQNQPFWIRVKPPKGTPAGVYKGLLEIASKSADGREQKSATPIAVQVFGFTFPDTTTINTAFGTSDNWIFKYHNVKTREDQQKVYALYTQALTDHHLSPYVPFLGFNDIKVRWEDLAHPLKAEPVFDWAVWDEQMEKAVKEQHITSFRLHLEGIGSGDYAHHVDPEYLGYKGGTAEYEALMSKYLGGIDQHLAEKGWDKRAIVYWYDEPNPEDYPRVMKGFETLRKYMPHVRLMLTEEPVKGLLGGPNLWCPTSCNLHAPAEAEARARGDDFWWYICTQPKAPYATEFTDHPGSELRVWLWQTWMEKVTGVLIWTTTWWSCDSLYPTTLQNPYVDAMCWDPWSTFGPWGNGDGRFLYPPLALANGPKGDQLNFENPVISLRLEILRDGIEDYEYFAMLKRLLASKPNLPPELRAQYEALLQVPASVTTSMTSFTIDPKPMEDHRYRLALAIEQLLH